MRGIVVVLLLTSTLAAQEGVGLEFGKKPFKIHALEFEVKVPVDWQVQHDNRIMTVQDRTGVGYQITREPMLGDPKTYADTWRSTLVGGGVKTDVKQVRAGRYTAWHAAWKSEAGGGRDISVWRVHAPENEMLYNIAFSAPSGGDVESLTEGVLRSFKCTAPKPRIRFQATATTIGDRLSLTLPVGYVEVPRGVRLGGGSQVAYTRALPGYEPAHEAGRIGLSMMSSGGTRMPDGSVMSGSNLKEVTAYFWGQLEGQLGEVTKKPRARASRHAGLKGMSLQGKVLAKSGAPKSVFVFAGKMKRRVLIISITVDDRVARLHKDYFKQVCAKLETIE